MAENDHEVFVAIVGLGLSSIQLIRQLEREGVDYKVLTKQAFGIWAKIYEVGENFDLVSTTESTNFHDMQWEYDFPFYTARQYYEMLLAMLTPEIKAHIRYTTVSEASWSTSRGQWLLTGADGRALARAKHLVCSIGYEHDGNILDNMRRAMALKDSTVLVKGFSDSANIFISRGSCSTTTRSDTLRRYYTILWW